MLNKLLRASALLAVISPYAGAQEISHTRTEKFSPVRASHAELYDVLTRMRSLIGSANANDRTIYEREDLWLSGGSTTINLSGEFAEQSLREAPDPSTEVRYEYHNGTAPISAVYVELRDYERELRVSGTSREQVDALTALLVQDIRALEGGFGGSFSRYIVGLGLLLIGAVLMGLGVTLLPALSLQLGAFALGLAVQVSWWVLPWDRWFPGTIVRPEATPLLERHAPVLTLLGLVVGMLALLGGTVRQRQLARAGDPPNEGAS